MATTVIRNFDLYNTTIYWSGYYIPNFEIEFDVVQAKYFTSNSSNIIGSQIDFFNALGGIPNTSNVFTLSTSLSSLPFLWKKHWWDEAMFYSHPIVLSAISLSLPDLYQDFSESVGSLYYISRYNNLLNTQTVVFSPAIQNLLVPGVSDAVQAFYSIANSLFITNLSAIGPGSSLDTAPSNGTLIMADTDLTRRITSNTNLVTTINNLYPLIYDFLPFNTTIQGNLITPRYWSVSANCEGTVISVDSNNTTIANQRQASSRTLIAK